jgi:hypothetical protein
MEQIEASLRATYRAFLARGLAAGEAANLTAFLHGLPSAGLQWTLPEIEAIVSRRLKRAAELRAAGHPAARRRAAQPAGRTIHDRRHARTGSTHVFDPPKP